MRVETRRPVSSLLSLHAIISAAAPTTTAATDSSNAIATAKRALVKRAP
jgi:hypothetical protein